MRKKERHQGEHFPQTTLKRFRQSYSGHFLKQAFPELASQFFDATHSLPAWNDFLTGFSAKAEAVLTRKFTVHLRTFLPLQSP